MADANLLEILEKNTKGLSDMIVYGNIRCAISRPSYLSNNTRVADGFFVLVDVLALRCNGIDHFSEYSGYQDSKHIYFSKGSIVAVIDDKSLIGKNVRIYGSTLKGCTIKKQMYTKDREGVVAFAWRKDNSGFYIVPNRVLPFGVSDAKGTVLEDYLVCLVGGTDFTFTHPDSVESIVEYEGVADVEAISFDDIKGGLEYSKEPIDLSAIPLNLVHRLAVKEKSAYADAVGEAINSLKSLSKKYATGVVNDIRYKCSSETDEEYDGVRSCDIADEIVYKFINTIASRYNMPLSNNVKVKGKDFVDDILDEMYTVRFRSKDDNEKQETNVSIELFKEIENLKKSVALDHTVLEPGRNTVPVLMDWRKFATLIIGSVTGIGVSTMVSNYNSVSRYNELELDEWFWCLMRNPYLCGLMGSDLNIWDCDRIFFGFTSTFGEEDLDFKECMKYRDILLMLDTIKGASSRSTLIHRRDLSNPNDKYPALGKRYITENGSPYRKENRVAVELLNSREIKADDKVVKRFIRTEELLKELNEAGLIEEVNKGIILTSDLNKEYIIYTKLIEKGNELTGISEEEVSDTIEKFQESRGFKLEKLQADGINIVRYKAGVLSGCAGSGKTTTSDCMVMAIEDYLPDYQLRFGAPTGKAARRLAEVVGGNVKTIHSMFGLGLGGDPYIAKNTRFRRKNDEGVSYAYFLDEMAMANSNLMYEIVEHLNDEDLVYFLGDIKQLSPIGKGSPFRALMQFLPCVELGVSKRAAANGKINYNVGLINFVSDEKVVELQEGDDFEITSCADADIQRNTVEAFKRALEAGYEEDDIQVVTGYQTDKYPWSTVNLNPLLQKLLRKEEEQLYMYNEQMFMKNDRVIHVKRNAYDMPRYRRTGTSSFEEVVTFGVVNGELGKIVGYVRSDMCDIRKWEYSYTDEEWNNLSPEMKKLVNKRQDTSVDIRDESQIRDEGTYFVMVQVYDVDLMEDVVIFYRATYKEGVSNEFYGRVFSGGDLRFLDLAYALTTHKMQGSQNPYIIIPLGSTSSPQFMNRNMLNTAITRASKKVTLIGSVNGKNSALTNGRRVTNIDDGEDVLGLLS